jgi:hypothetical protein
MHPNFKEFTVGAHVYRCGKMNVRTQFHVSRRLLPIFVGLAKGGEADDMIGQFGGLAEALAELKDDEADYVISHCLQVVQRKLPGDTGWAPVWSNSGNTLMMDDIGMVEMLQMVAEVIGHNLANFTEGLPSGLKGLMQNT